MDLERNVVVEIGESNPVLRPHWLSDDHFVDVIELVPILILKLLILDQRFKLGTAWNGHVEGLSCEEGLQVKEIEVVAVHKVSQQLVG